MKTLSLVTDNKIVLSHPYIKDYLILDTETNSLNTQTGTVKFIGFYSYKYKKYFLINALTERKYAEKLLSEHKCIVGFNNKEFDHPMLSNEVNKFDLSYKITFDCLQVLYNIKKRKSNREDMIKHNGKTLASLLPNRKLKTIAEVLGFPCKGEIDYKIFQQDSWTDEELKEIFKYLFLDIDITRRIFEFFVEYFDSFKEYVGEDNIRKLNYIRSTGGSFAYSAVCYNCNLPEEYEQDEVVRIELKKKAKELNKGGYVLSPQIPYAENVVCADITSMYPNNMWQINVFSPVNEGEGWHGDNFFDIKGWYNDKEQGKVENFLKKVFLKRIEYKKNKDQRELGLKILMNACYGISSSPTFKSLFDVNRGADITSVSRKVITYMKECLERKGYKIIYIDTDSNFIQLGKNTIDDFKKDSKEIINDLMSHMPFPSPETFNFVIDVIYKKIWFFSKKFYIGITDEDKLIIKGLSIIKHDATELGKKILNIIKPEIIKQNSCKFTKKYFENLINEEIKKDIKIIAKIYSVKDTSYYKNTSSIQAQISAVYGSGEHYLICNSKLGNIGKGKKYLHINSAIELDVKDLILDKLWKELEPFIEVENCNNM